MTSPHADRIGLPPKPFMYTLDQIAFLLEVDLKHLERAYIHYEGRSVGACPKDKIPARDISPRDAERTDWRVSERALTNWLRYKGFRFHTRGYVL